jgi:hypothetical protein
MVDDSLHLLGHRTEPTFAALKAGPLGTWWSALPDTLRSLSWPGALAAISILGLLLAFHQVVSGSVRLGELRRAATAMQSEATWRCNALASLRLREGCLVQLSAVPHDEAALRARSVRGGE